MLRSIRDRFSISRRKGNVLDIKGEVTGSVADGIIMLSRQGDSAPIATAILQPNGKFTAEGLPESLRGAMLKIKRIDSTGRSKDLADFQVPLIGNAFVVVRQKVDIDKGLNDAAELERLIDSTKIKEDAFSNARKKLEKIRPEQPNWAEARKVVRSWGNLRFAKPSLRIPSEKMKGWNRKDIFKRPSSGFDVNIPRSARLLLSPKNAIELGNNPTLCKAVIAGEKSRGFERKGRLIDRLMRRLRLDKISIMTGKTPTPPVATPNEETKEELEQRVDKEVLKRAAAAISDLKDTSQSVATTADDLMRIRAVVEKLELAQGTANVVAAREVHSLQIAFLNEVSPNDDNDTLGLIAEWWALNIRLKADYDADLPEIKPGSKKDFIDQLAFMKQRLRTSMAVEPVPKSIITRRPDIDSMTWARLNDDAKSIIIANLNNSIYKEK